MTTTISNAMYRKAVEIVNRGDVVDNGDGTFSVYRADIDSWALVAPTRKNPNRFTSTGQWFQRFGRQDTYITSVKIANEINNFAVTG